MTAIPLLGKYPEEMKILAGKDMCIPMFIIALFIVAKTWKQHKYPTAETNYYI